MKDFQSKTPQDAIFPNLGSASLKARDAGWTFDDGSGKTHNFRAVYNGSKTYDASTSKPVTISCFAGPHAAIERCI